MPSVNSPWTLFAFSWVFLYLLRIMSFCIIQNIVIFYLSLVVGPCDQTLLVCTNDLKRLNNVRRDAFKQSIRSLIPVTLVWPWPGISFNRCFSNLSIAWLGTLPGACSSASVFMRLYTYVFLVNFLRMCWEGFYLISRVPKMRKTLRGFRLVIPKLHMKCAYCRIWNLYLFILQKIMWCEPTTRSSVKDVPSGLR